MARFYERLNTELETFIGRQHVFFTASAPRVGGHVNLSPKGMDSFRVLDPNTVAYLDVTGSGAETAAHVRENGRLTVMFCSFEAKPLILRLYGSGEVLLPADPGWAMNRPLFPDHPGARAIVLLHVSEIQTSCGFGVPLMAYQGERGDLVHWARKKGEEGLRRYRREKNRESMDGLPSGFGEDG